MFAAVFGFVGFYAAGPFLAMNEIRDAVAYNDKVKFEKYVDLQAITENMKIGFNRKVEGDRTEKEESLVGAALGSAIAKTIVGGAVDLMVTPDTAMEVLNKALRQPDPKWDWDFANWDRFILSVYGKEEKKLDLILRSEGLSWRLKSVEGIY